MWNPFKSITKRIGGWAKKKITMMIIKRLLQEVLKMGWLQGYKTYIVAGFAILTAVGNLVTKFLNGEPITMEDIMMLLAALGLTTLRAGIKNG